MSKSLLAIVAGIAASLALTGCVVSNDSDRAPTVRHEASNRPAVCDAKRYQSLIGQDASSIDRATLPSAFRIVCAGCAMTRDYNESRLTLILDTADRVESASCN